MIKTLEELNIRRVMNWVGWGGGVIILSENKVSRARETQMH